MEIEILGLFTVNERLLWVEFSLSTKFGAGLLHTQQQTVEVIHRSSIYGPDCVKTQKFVLNGWRCLSGSIKERSWCLNSTINISV